MHQRNAFTLLELIVSLASSIILVAGLAGSLSISNQALEGSSNARQSLAASTVLRDMMADIGEAKSFTERTDRLIEFTVPDRNEDEAPEVIRYAWSGVVGEPLTYQYNGSAAVDVAADVQAFDLSALTRELTPVSNPASDAENVTFHGPATETQLSTASTQMNINLPAGTSEGDLLIACVTTDGGTVLTDPPGWSRLYVGWNNGTKTFTTAVTFGVWWKLAASSEPGTHQFTWDVSKRAYGWMMRFSGHDPTNPINASYLAVGSANSTPPSPAVTTTVENTMILRLGGFDANRITIDSPGLSTPTQHTPITMDYSNNSTLGCSGGAGYLPQSIAGSSNTSTFTLTPPGEEYVTVTIAIAPDTSE